MKPYFLSVAWAGWLLAAVSPGSFALAADLLAPMNPQAAVPPVVYRSVLPAPRALDEPAAGDWPALNEQVRRVGGWRAYARQGLPAPAPAASPASAAAAGGRS